jgi:hypothetical protein
LRQRYRELPAKFSPETRSPLEQSRRESDGPKASAFYPASIGRKNYDKISQDAIGAKSAPHMNDDI